MTLTAEQKVEYKDKDPIAGYTLSNCGGVAILDILYGIDDYVVYRYYDDEPDVEKIEYNEEGEPYFIINHGSMGLSINFEECECM